MLSSNGKAKVRVVKSRVAKSGWPEARWPKEVVRGLVARGRVTRGPPHGRENQESKSFVLRTYIVGGMGVRELNID